MRRSAAIRALLPLMALAPPPARAQSVTVRVYEAAFNDLAGRVQPLTMTGRYRLQVAFATPFGPVSITVCDSAWTVTVSQLRFAISPAAASINGRVDATWCGLAFNSTVATTADVRYDAVQRAVSVGVNPTAIQPRFNVIGLNIALPFFIDVAPSLTLPPIPVTTGLVYFETARGVVDLRISAQNVTVSKGTGYVELRGNLSVW